MASDTVNDERYCLYLEGKEICAGYPEVDLAPHVSVVDIGYGLHEVEVIFGSTSHACRIRKYNIYSWIYVFYNNNEIYCASYNMISGVL